MIRSITLQNFKSFGERQEIPLEPITVLVGPNNSGKSSFMSVGRFVANMVVGGLSDAIREEGGESFAYHRPPHGSGELELGWRSEVWDYSLQLEERRSATSIAQERLIGIGTAEGLGFSRERGELRSSANVRSNIDSTQLGILRPSSAKNEEIIKPFVRSRLIKLSLSALRSDAEVVPRPQLAQNGAGLAAVLGLWRGSQPEKCEELDSFLRKCLPEVRNALVRPAPTPGAQRLWVRQVDGEEFDSEHLSDGLLCFIGLTMHAIAAGDGQLLFIEEPEHSIHPRRLHELVDLLKELVASKGCQFVIATHSPVLLNAFRDEPEAILLFRRSETGTKVKRLEDVPELKAALQNAPPGDLLEHGFFNQAF